MQICLMTSFANFSINVSYYMYNSALNIELES